mmetsp:Transcript_9020/g.8018  ORF Transcript_9020/g.8018 Transcript_9020/m.8018 type:complete len:92 (+) Transcript_9020:25-300(+)
MSKITTSTQLEAWRQRLNTENKASRTKDLADIDKLQAQLDSKNTYFNIYKKDEVKAKEEEDEKQKEDLGFDMTHELEVPENKTWQKKKKIW